MCADFCYILTGLRLGSGVAQLNTSWLEVFLAPYSANNGVIHLVRENWVHAYAGSQALFLLI